MVKDLIQYLSQYVTEKRMSLFMNVVKNRTQYLTVVLEDIYQRQNASAVLRSCDCFGVQDVHVIENRNDFEIDPNVAMGASKWLTINHYNEGGNNTGKALHQLKKDGYRIIATSPHENDVLLDDFDFEAGKFALVFGTELLGVSEDVKQNADAFLKIPMYGFTESFNISVSAAIVLHYLTHKMKKSSVNWQLSHEESDELIMKWLKNSIKGSEALVEYYNERNMI
ncbi:MAG: RNA methyltransferase [Prolixibacteraceae bacterium]|jgi:tRNA (guanosine-2'-O-)-methyltransferase|nr:RNA methyltransferase [Prolixibacteraceae bacterium]